MAEKPDMADAQQKLVENIRRLMECPVCLDVITTSAIQCARGHVVCSAPCGTKLKQCPLCQQQFLQDKPTIVNNLIGILPRYCRYSLDKGGCREICLAGDDHEEFCGFRKIACREDFCKDDVMICEFEKHYKRNHALSVIVKKEKMDLVWLGFDGCFEDMDHIPVILPDCFFYLKRHHYRSETLTYVLEAFPIGKPKSETFITINFEKDNFKFSKTFKPIIMKDLMCSSKIDSCQDLLEKVPNPENFCMTVSKEFVSYILDADELKWSQHIFQK